MALESTWKRIWIRVKRRYDTSPHPNDTSASIQQLRALFEGREAIYIEKGALRVRVNDIRGSASHATISAKVEEIPTPGLDVSLRDGSQRVRPAQWRICSGYLTTFSDHNWEMGYGGWSLYFDPKAVQGVLDLTSRLPANMDSWERYNMIIGFLQDNRTFCPAKVKRVFPDP